VPSVLAGMLARREVQCALVSSVGVLEDAELCAMDAAGVVSDGPVASIRLMSRVPPDEISTLALDSSSRTGIILGRVMLSKAYCVRPEVVTLPPDVPAMLEVADAALVIGDPALRASLDLEVGRLPMVHCDLDMGSLWRDATGLPFVYAVWTAHREDASDELDALLSKALTWGTAHLDEIAGREASRLGMPEDFCRRYLRDNVRYHLGPREWDGLATFGMTATEMGLLPKQIGSVRRDKT
jgi:chorismate dehydratase